MSSAQIHLVVVLLLPTWTQIFFIGIFLYYYKHKIKVQVKKSLENQLESSYIIKISEIEYGEHKNYQDSQYYDKKIKDFKIKR